MLYFNYKSKFIVINLLCCEPPKRKFNQFHCKSKIIIQALTCSALSPRGGGLTEFNCKSKFTRRYIEVDDELVSVITDIEDDDLGAATGWMILEQS